MRAGAGVINKRAPRASQMATGHVHPQFGPQFGRPKSNTCGLNNFDFFFLIQYTIQYTFNNIQMESRESRLRRYVNEESRLRRYVNEADQNQNPEPDQPSKPLSINIKTNDAQDSARMNKAQPTYKEAMTAYENAKNAYELNPTYEKFRELQDDKKKLKRTISSNRAGVLRDQIKIIRKYLPSDELIDIALEDMDTWGGQNTSYEDWITLYRKDALAAITTNMRQYPDAQKAHDEKQKAYDQVQQARKHNNIIRNIREAAGKVRTAATNAATNIREKLTRGHSRTENTDNAATANTVAAPANTVAATRAGKIRTAASAETAATAGRRMRRASRRRAQSRLRTSAHGNSRKNNRSRGKSARRSLSRRSSRSLTRSSMRKRRSTSS